MPETPDLTAAEKLGRMKMFAESECGYFGDQSKEALNWLIESHARLLAAAKATLASFEILQSVFRAEATRRGMTLDAEHVENLRAAIANAEGKE